MDGVYGPLAQHNHDSNGGPTCAAQSTAYFKASINILLVSLVKLILVTISNVGTQMGQFNSYKGNVIEITTAKTIEFNQAYKSRKINGVYLSCKFIDKYLFKVLV